jgi:hypothetical protein
MSTFDESKHPREPKGAADSKGGQFATHLSFRSRFERVVAGAMNNLVAEDGGFTFQPATAEVPTEGMSVSINPELSRSFPMGSVTLDDFMTFYVTNAAKFSDRANYFGGWNHKGRTYFDVARIVSTHEEAKALCFKHDQIAYFDLKTFQEHIVNPGAKSGGAAP